MSDRGLSAPFARRDFLKISSVAVAGLMTGGWPSTLFGASSASILSAGYSDAEPKEGELLRLRSAAALLSGDMQFIKRDAKVTMRSFHSAVQGGPDSVAIDVVYPVLGYQPDSYPVYHAWMYRRDHLTESASAAGTFRVPVDAMDGMRLVFTRFTSARIAAASEDAKAQTTPDDTMQFSLATAPGTAKLRRGLYVVSYREPGVSSVGNWSTLSITRKDNDLIVPGASFAYLVFSVDYAD